MPDPTILIVEDEAIIAMDIETHLIDLGYTVIGIAPTGKRALEMATQSTPDLILMDIKLRGDMDGVTAAQLISQQFDLPIIFLTAHIDPETLARAKTTQPFGYLIKPFRDKELQSAIEIALYKHTMEQKLRESEERLRLLIESGNDMAIIQDLQGKYLYYHGASSLGITHNDVVGKTPFDFHSPEIAQTIVDRIKLVAATGEAIKTETMLEWQNQTLWFSDYTYPLKNHAGKITSVATISRNITELKQIKKLLPICAWCGRKIRNEQGEWQQLDLYLAETTGATITHSICDDCRQKFYQAEA